MENTKEMQDLFFEWLKNKNILDEYCREYMLQNRDEAWTDRVAREDYNEWINLAFRWLDTSGGGDYWFDIHEDWKIYSKDRWGQTNNYIIEYNGVKYSEKTLHSILDKFERSKMKDKTEKYAKN